MTIDSRDAVLQASAPTIMVPLYGEFQPLESAGHRFLAAQNGLWLEARRPWLYVRHPIAPQEAVVLPYGRLDPEISLICGRLPKDALDTFIQKAVAECPTDTVAAVIWDCANNNMTYRVLESIAISDRHIDFLKPHLTATQYLICDLHSHGTVHAYFSDEDDEADFGDFKISLVVGNCDTERPTIQARLCCNGLYLPMDISELFE